MPRSTIVFVDFEAARESRATLTIHDTRSWRLTTSRAHKLLEAMEYSDRNHCAARRHERKHHEYLKHRKA